MSYNNESSVAGSSRSLNRNVSSPTSNHTEDPTFWVPAGTSIGHCSDIPSGWSSFLSGNNFLIQFYSSSDDSDPPSPNSPTSSNRSFALSVNSIPIVRSDKHVVLTTTSPARPKMASMQAKLDHTKIDTSLYQVMDPFRRITESFLTFSFLRTLHKGIRQWHRKTYAAPSTSQCCTTQWPVF